MTGNKLENISQKELIHTLPNTRVEIHSGPLPPPEILENYNNILPGSAEHIIKMAETQQLHRHTLETKTVFIETIKLFIEPLAIICSTVCFSIPTILGFISIWKGFEVTGFITSLVGPCWYRNSFSNLVSKKFQKVN